ncbi:MAG: hypothetical protein ACREQ9_20375, partial [Candidatus Binatia bacterium]
MRVAGTARFCLAAAPGVALCFVPERSLALAAAAFVVVAMPAWAVGRAIAAGDPDGDRIDFLAASFGGVALSSLAVWTGAVLVGLSRTEVIVAPLVASLLLHLFTDASGETVRKSGAGRTGWILFVVAGCFALLVALPFLPYGWERADGVHRMGLSDWYLHLMITSALDAAHSLPPRNPYLWADAGAHYHYGFHLVGAAIHRAAGRQGDVFPALLALTMLTAFAFPVVLFVVSRRTLDGDPRAALLAAAAGVFLFGFDLVVWVANALPDLVGAWPPSDGFAAIRAAVPSAHLDHWIEHDERQFNAPYTALLWAPHHVAAVVTALLAIHALRARTRGSAIVVPVACLLASLPGLSGYVAITAAVGAAAVVVADQVAGGRFFRRSTTVLRWGAVGVGALVLSTPILASLRGSVGQHFAPLTVHLSSAGDWRNGAVFTTLFGHHSWTHLLDTPALYLFEFGLVGALGAAELVRRARRREWTAVRRENAAILVAVFLFLNFVRPPLGGPNNLNFRPMLVVWSLLVPFAVEAWLRP